VHFGEEVGEEDDEFGHEAEENAEPEGVEIGFGVYDEKAE
jgi:hypothetical protein